MERVTTPISNAASANNRSNASTPVTGGFGLPAPVHPNISFTIDRHSRSGSGGIQAAGAAGAGGPQPHPVPNLHGPAAPLHVPNKTPAPTRGCSPHRYRSRLSDIHERSATEMSLQQHYYTPPMDISLLQTTTLVNDKSNSPNLSRSGPLVQGGHNFVVDNNNREHFLQHSPSGASCPVCGALRLPNIDLRNDAALSVKYH